MVSPLEGGGLKDEIYADNDIVISDSTIHNTLSPQLKKMSARYKVMCGCECCISVKSMHYYLVKWRDNHLKHLKE